ncbi:MAG: type 4a pilus biogenesis protein PilO [Candidatus Omnitrophica bacterium]|nr:type 4a pilus biogenesis protein PilO [Candidatus Omnitrophota bacterium]MBU1933081.1 type 4a pilus biogenesis protein PilO [Candidatus Omnitrophota bacterium]
MELTKDRAAIIITGVIAVVTLGVYLFLYRPAISKCSEAGCECRMIESEVLRARESMYLLKQDAAKRVFVSENNISVAIDELTKQGRSKGINFTSITPGKIENPGDVGYKILPIDMEIESTYKELAVFLGLLEGLKESLVTVKDIDIASEEIRSAKLRARLILNMYLSYQ